MSKSSVSAKSEEKEEPKESKLELLLRTISEEAVEIIALGKQIASEGKITETALRTFLKLVIPHKENAKIYSAR